MEVGGGGRRWEGENRISWNLILIRSNETLQILIPLLQPDMTTPPWPWQKMGALFSVKVYIIKSKVLIKTQLKIPYETAFPGGAVVTNLPANAGDTGSSPGPGRSHMPRSN